MGDVKPNGTENIDECFKTLLSGKLLALLISVK